jgi:ABC-type Fe3+/spermidine/putrescine transport system ATPase subunit
VTISSPPSRSFEAVVCNPRLELRRLTKVTSGTRIVDCFNLSIAPGESVVLLGASGCGKTTTLRMIAGFDPPTDGEIYLDGKLVSHAGFMTPTERRRLGMVFQSYAVWPHKTVAENIVYGLVVAGMSRQKIRERLSSLLRTVRLEGLADRYPAQLSGGQQQRVALARAIANEPSLLLLDEPLSNLDAALRHQMRIELKELHKRLGMTMLFVTHDQEEALVLADRVIVMKDGRVEQAGAPEDIYRRPRSRFVASFVGVSNILDGRVEARDVARGRILVRTARGLGVWGRAYPDAIAELNEGSPAALVVRPEDVTLAPVGAGDGALARVKTTVFLGNHYQIQLDLGGALCHAHARSLDMRPGDEAIVTVDEATAWVVP